MKVIQAKGIVGSWEILCNLYLFYLDIQKKAGKTKALFCGFLYGGWKLIPHWGGGNSYVKELDKDDTGA